MHYFEKRLRKEYLGKEDYKDTFQTPTLLWENDDWDKLLEFQEYIGKIRCVNCGRRYTGCDKIKKTVGNYNLLLQCENCLSNDILEDHVTQGYVKWLDDALLSMGAASFEEGFPIIPKFKINWAGAKKSVKVDF